MPLAKFCEQVNASAGKAGSKPEGPPSAARGDVTVPILSNLEFGMVQSLQFELAVHGAHRALYGFILDVQTLDTKMSREDIVVLASAAQSHVQLSRLSDAEFIYAPAHIALAACFLCANVRAKTENPPCTGAQLIQAWIEAKCRICAALQTQGREERETVRAKKQSLREVHEKELAKERKSTDLSIVSPSDTVSKDSAAVHPLGIEKDQLFSILSEIAALISSVAEPNDGNETGPPRPHLDMEHVKKVDLNLRACLALFEKAQNFRCVGFSLLTQLAEAISRKSCSRHQKTSYSYPWLG